MLTKVTVIWSCTIVMPKSYSVVVRPNRHERKRDVVVIVINVIAGATMVIQVRLGEEAPPFGVKGAAAVTAGVAVAPAGLEKLFLWI